nr:MAG TPA: hypothetical protein [Caudoviricetes sp.]
MESVIVSIKPEWIEKIVRGEKTIEVRKSAPKEVPFKAYIYETKHATEMPWVDEDGHFIYKGRGQVIGEFVCDKILEIEVFKNGAIENFWLYDLYKSCLSFDEMGAYIGKGNIGYGWHISDLKIYDKPKELSEFWGLTHCLAADTMECWSCFAPCKERDGKHYKPLTRPPQSWQYLY